MSELDQAFAQANEQDKPKQDSYTIAEFITKHGMARRGHQNMQNPDGSTFEAHGFKFGESPKAVFCAFSAKLSHDDQTQRNPEFVNLNPVEVGNKVWANKDKFQVLHKADKTTGELLFRKNGEPIYIICPLNDFTIDDGALE